MRGLGPCKALYSLPLYLVIYGFRKWQQDRRLITVRVTVPYDAAVKMPFLPLSSAIAETQRGNCRYSIQQHDPIEGVSRCQENWQLTNPSQA